MSCSITQDILYRCSTTYFNGQEQREQVLKLDSFGWNKVHLYQPGCKTTNPWDKLNVPVINHARKDMFSTIGTMCLATGTFTHDDIT